jgi:hypothetical protein
LLLLGLVLGFAVPWAFMRMMVPALSGGATAVNYRNREVFLGLGIVWLVWAGCAIIGGVASSMLQGATRASVLPILTLAGPLALVAFALGLVDDALGSGASRGFRGHLTALRHGTLTTGGLKLFGISLASLFVALILSGVSPWGAYSGGGGELLNAAIALLAGAAIALTSNFVNLTDLRPGRALKVSSVLMVVGVVSAGLLLTASGSAGIAASGSARAVDALVLALFTLGPLAAVYRYDMGEMGMLGDAGANPMGAVAGLLIVSGLPLWGLLVYLAIMLALNLLSERVSFSSVIDSNGVLTWFDSLGRIDEQDSDTYATGAHTDDNPE